MGKVVICIWSRSHFKIQKVALACYTCLIVAVFLYVCVCARTFNVSSEGVTLLWQLARRRPGWHLPEMTRFLVCSFKAENLKVCLEDKPYRREKHFSGCVTKCHIFVFYVGLCGVKSVEMFRQEKENKMSEAASYLFVCCGWCIFVGLACKCPCVLWCFPQSCLIWLCCFLFFFKSVRPAGGVLHFHPDNVCSEDRDKVSMKHDHRLFSLLFFWFK